MEMAKGFDAHPTIHITKYSNFPPEPFTPHFFHSRCFPVGFTRSLFGKLDLGGLGVSAQTADPATRPRIKRLKMDGWMDDLGATVLRPGLFSWKDLSCKSWSSTAKSELNFGVLTIPPGGVRGPKAF